MKPVPVILIIIVMFVSATFSAKALIPFGTALVAIHRDAEQKKITPDQTRERSAQSYIVAIGNSAGWQAATFSSLAIIGGLVASAFKRWWTKLLPMTLLGGVFYLSSYTFLLAEESVELLSEAQRGALLGPIVALKMASVFVGLISGGLIFECGKEWVGIK